MNKKTIWLISGIFACIIIAVCLIKLPYWNGFGDTGMNKSRANGAQNPNFGMINVKDYGANGDGISDDTKAVQEAIDAAIADGFNYIVYFPPAKGYKISNTVKVPPNTSVTMEGPIIFSGKDDIPAIVVGVPDKFSANVHLKLNVIKKIQSNWTSEECIGVKIINAYTSHIEIIQARGFTIGVQFIGSSKGFVYNKVDLGVLLENKIGVDCTNENKGYCNENLFLGGRFGVAPKANPGLSRYGIRITSKDESYVSNNNNFFMKPSFELYREAALPGEAIPILIVHGKLNKFDSIRNEGNSKNLARIANQSEHNIIAVGYGFPHNDAIDDLSTKKANKVNWRQDRLE